MSITKQEYYAAIAVIMQFEATMFEESANESSPVDSVSTVEDEGIY